MSSESGSTTPDRGPDGTDGGATEADGGRLGRQIRGVIYLLTGLFAAALAIYLLLRPAELRGMHPLPLLALLGVSLLIALWQAWQLLR